MKSWFLIDIFRAFVRFDRQAAEEIIKQIDDPYRQITARLELAKSPRDLQQVLAAIKTLEPDNIAAGLLSKIAAKLGI